MTSLLSHVQAEDSAPIPEPAAEPASEPPKVSSSHPVATLLTDIRQSRRLQPVEPAKRTPVVFPKPTPAEAAPEPGAAEKPKARKMGGLLMMALKKGDLEKAVDAMDAAAAEEPAGGDAKVSACVCLAPATSGPHAAALSNRRREVRRGRRCFRAPRPAKPPTPRSVPMTRT
jgi:hypothetical protein